MIDRGSPSPSDRGWHTERLAELGTWVGGGTPSKRVSEYWEGGTIPWVSPKDMKHPILKATIDQITPTAVEKSSVRVFGPDSIAVVVRSGILQHTLPVALVPFRASANQDMRVLKPRAELEPRWVLYSLIAHADDIRRACSKHGTTVASIDVPKLMEFSIPVPSADEQVEIVQRVSSTKRSLESADQFLDRVRLEGEALWRSILRQTFVGKGR